MTQKEFLKKTKPDHVRFASAIHDFLATGSGTNDKISQTPKYYYKEFKGGGNKEIRYWKLSKRVSVSKTKTIKK